MRSFFQIVLQGSERMYATARDETATLNFKSVYFGSLDRYLRVTVTLSKDVMDVHIHIPSEYTASPTAGV